MPFADARRIIDEGAGTQFDPAVVDAFHQLSDATLRRIAEAHS
jgi:response regulator RpfG family c-di-GMP phosphodiesterase